MSEPVQNFKNHTKFDPKFLFVAPLSLGLMLWAWVHHFRVHTLDSFFIAATLLLLLVAIFTVRTYSLKVQDRVIRLEERLRLQSLGCARILDLTEGQLIALRFASDGEVVGLAQKALNEGLKAKEIKAQIQNWRADFWRV